MKKFIYNLEKYLYLPEEQLIISIKDGIPKCQYQAYDFDEDDLPDTVKHQIDEEKWVYIDKPESVLDAINDCFESSFELWDLLSPQEKRSQTNEVFRVFYERLKSYRLENYKIESNNYSVKGYVAQLLLKTDVKSLSDKLNHILNIIEDKPSDVDFDRMYDYKSKKYLDFYDEVQKLLNHYLNLFQEYTDNPKKAIDRKINLPNNYLEENSLFYRTIHIDNKETLIDILKDYFEYNKVQALLYFLNEDPINSLDDLEKRNVFLNIHSKTNQVLETVGDAESIKTKKQGRQDNLKTTLSEPKSINKTKSIKGTIDLQEDIKKQIKDIKLSIVTLRKKKIKDSEGNELEALFNQIFTLENNSKVEELSRKELHDFKRQLRDTFDLVFQLKKKYR